jgi:hypothetical protein
VSIDNHWREMGIVNVFTPIGNLHFRDLRKARLMFSDRNYPLGFPWWITAGRYQLRIIRTRNRSITKRRA